MLRLIDCPVNSAIQLWMESNAESGMEYRGLRAPQRFESKFKNSQVRTGNGRIGKLAEFSSQFSIFSFYTISSSEYTVPVSAE